MTATADALAAATEALDAAGVDSPRLDAELLLAAASGRGRAALAASPQAPVEGPAARRFAESVRRRLRREPLAYILGRRGFRGLELEVGPAVLVPRPETELLVEVALELEPLSVLDVGTGSGAVALALADELANATIVATDTSPAALAIARANTERLGFAPRVDLRPGSLPQEGSFDLLVANLPYVNESEWERLEPELREHEPREALVAGPSGLEAIESVLGALAVSTSVAAGAVALEVGAGQAGAVAELVRRAGYERVEARRDLAGIERVVLGQGWAA